jgi:hypothetical protein
VRLEQQHPNRLFIGSKRLSLGGARLSLGEYRKRANRFEVSVELEQACPRESCVR